MVVCSSSSSSSSGGGGVGGGEDRKVRLDFFMRLWRRRSGEFLKSTATLPTREEDIQHSHSDWAPQHPCSCHLSFTSGFVLTAVHGPTSECPSGVLYTIMPTEYSLLCDDLDRIG